MELVDGAQKEDKIEVKLNQITSVREVLKFDFKEYNEVPTLAEIGEIVEFLE